MVVVDWLVSVVDSEGSGVNLTVIEWGVIFSWLWFAEYLTIVSVNDLGAILSPGAWLLPTPH